MNDPGILIGIAIAIIVSVLMIVKAIAQRQMLNVTKAREQEARDLEIKIRMATGLDVVNDFNQLAQVYVSMNRFNDAENCMRKALAITENELGQKDPTLKPLLENYASVLEKMNRHTEANHTRKRANELDSKKR